MKSVKRWGVRRSCLDVVTELCFLIDFHVNEPLVILCFTLILRLSCSNRLRNVATMLILPLIVFRIMKFYMNQFWCPRVLHFFVIEIYQPATTFDCLGLFRPPKRCSKDLGRGSRLTGVCITCKVFLISLNMIPFACSRTGGLLVTLEMMDELQLYSRLLC